MIAEIIGWEVLVPLLLIAVFFGAGKIPELARSLGRAQHEFRKGVEGEHDDEPDDAPRS